jgi:D-alanine-D-alanine ligase
VRLGFTYNVRSTNGSSASTFGLAGDAEEEFDSPKTVDAIATSLRALGHEVDLLGDGEPMLRRLLEGPRPELVFNMAEGTGVGRSREARVPAVLEMLGIPHTGSDPLTLAIALDKPVAKTIVTAAGIAVPRGVVVDRSSCRHSVLGSSKDTGRSTSELRPSTFDLRASTLDLGPISDLGLRFPLIAKPAFEGSSKGVLAKSLIERHEDLHTVVEELLSAYQQPILVEEFIQGEELTVGITGNSPPQVIGVKGIVSQRDRQRFVYSLEVKRAWQDEVRYECPAKISASEMAAVEQAAIASYRALGCRDVARIDFRLRDGIPYFIEANPLPGLAPDWSDIVLLARAMGIEHRELLGRIVDSAALRYGLTAIALQG